MRRVLTERMGPDLGVSCPKCESKWVRILSGDGPHPAFNVGIVSAAMYLGNVYSCWECGHQWGRGSGQA